MKPTQTIVIAAFDGALPSSLNGIADMLALATFGIAKSNSPDQSMVWAPNVITASCKGCPIQDGRGHQFCVDAAFEDIKHCDAILVPGFSPDLRGRLSDCLTQQNSQQWIKNQHRKGALVYSSCSGAFALGEAGLLNRRKCTTTWWLYYELQQRFPMASTVWGVRLIKDGQVITAGGPLSWVDITLHAIDLLAGPKAASLAADFTVVDTIPKSQDICTTSMPGTDSDAFLFKAQQTVRYALDRRLTPQDLATAMSVSERTLHRRLKELTGKSPKTFIDGLRIDAACTLLQTSDCLIKNIALTLGYSEESVFRRIFRRYTGMTPTEYRHQISVQLAERDNTPKS